MQAQATQVIRHLSGTVGVRIAVEQLADVGADVACRNPVGSSANRHRVSSKAWTRRSPKAQGRSMLMVDDDRLGEGVEGVFAEQTVVAQRFDG